MPRKKAAGTKRRARAAPAAPPARPSRKTGRAGRAVRAVGTFAARGTVMAAEKIRQTVGRNNLTAAGAVAKSAGRAALEAGLTAAVRATAEGLIGLIGRRR